jgi:hypothetical protein
MINVIPGEPRVARRGNGDPFGIQIPFPFAAFRRLAGNDNGAKMPCHFGWIMSSGRTMVSNSSAVTSPVFKASSRKVVPFLCAVLAIFAALS